MLKTLEEPPKHAVFILATTEPDRILPTIHSRVQRLDFRRISLPQVVKKLKLIAEEEGFKYQEPALYLIAEESGGSLRDAETLFEKVALSLNTHSEITEELVADFLGHLSPKKILEFLELISQRKIDESFSFIFNIYAQGFDLNLFIKGLLKTIRQLIFLKLQPNYAKHLETEKPEEIIFTMKKMAEKFKIEELKKLSALFFEAEMDLRKEPPSPLLPLELALLEYFEVK